MRSSAKCTHNSFRMRSSEKSGGTGKLLTRRLKKNFYPEEYRDESSLLDDRCDVQPSKVQTGPAHTHSCSALLSLKGKG
jgi:hypothetical protein